MLKCKTAVAGLFIALLPSDHLHVFAFPTLLTAPAVPRSCHSRAAGFAFGRTCSAERLLGGAKGLAARRSSVVPRTAGNDGGEGVNKDKKPVARKDAFGNDVVPPDGETDNPFARRAFLASTLAPLMSVCAVYLALPALLNEKTRQADWYKRNFATRMAGMDDYEAHIKDMKEDLFSLVQPEASVVEIGAGLGPNIRMLPKGITYTAVEPNRFMHEAIQDRADAHFEYEQERLFVDDIRLIESGSADVVLSTLVLCSVSDQGEVLDEIKRVLKDGGTLIFLEHVLERDQGYPSPANIDKFPWDKWWYRQFQLAISPLQAALADGCHADRDTAAAIATRFPEVYYKRFNVPGAWDSPEWDKFFPIGPQVAGVAIKTPFRFDGQLAEVQFKFCAPEASDVTALSEQEVCLQTHGQERARTDAHTHTRTHTHTHQILRTAGDREKLEQLRYETGRADSKSWASKLRCTCKKYASECMVLNYHGYVYVCRYVYVYMDRCTGKEYTSDQQPWFLKRFQKDPVTGAFFKSSEPTD